MDEADIACAKLVQAKDTRRFKAAMAAPLPARKVLFTIYAANLEFAHAAWASSEGLIAQMRLQFWYDTIDALIGGKPPPYPHEIIPALARLSRPALEHLLKVITARGQDIDKSGWQDWTAAWAYAQDTAGAVMQAAYAALGQAPLDADFCTAHSVVCFLEAAPALKSHGLKIPDLSQATADLPPIKSFTHYLRAAPKAQRPALLEAWMSPWKLAQMHKTGKPASEITPSPFAQNGRLLIAGLWI